jgi:hypothetical protein
MKTKENNEQSLYDSKFEEILCEISRKWDFDNSKDAFHFIRALFSSIVPDIFKFKKLLEDGESREFERGLLDLIKNKIKYLKIGQCKKVSLLDLRDEIIGQDKPHGAIALMIGFFIEINFNDRESIELHHPGYRIPFDVLAYIKEYGEVTIGRDEDGRFYYHCPNSL